MREKEKETHKQIDKQAQRKTEIRIDNNQTEREKDRLRKGMRNKMIEREKKERVIERSNCDKGTWRQRDRQIGSGT